jgi:hypothetical protein
MDMGQAARLCTFNRSRFSGMAVARKIIDRGIVVLFVWKWVSPSLTFPVGLVFGANDGAIWRRTNGNSLLHEPVKEQSSGL